MFEPVIAVAASPREWSYRLRRHVADHGGARVRATVLRRQEALEESFDVFVVDDTTSFLTRRFVSELHQRGRRVLGVYEDPWGKGQLTELGVDQAIERQASAEDLLAVIWTLAADADSEVSSAMEPAPSALAPQGLITVVGGPVGGCGATEIAIGLAAALGSRGETVALVDGDGSAPSVAPRLGLACCPDLRAAVEGVTRGAGQLEVTLAPAAWCPEVRVLPGLAGGAGWSGLQPADVAAVVRQLASRHDHVVVDIGHLTGQPRDGQVRALVELAGTIVAVGAPTPVGMGHLLDWVAQTAPLAPSSQVHLVLNQVPSKRGHIAHQLRRFWSAPSLTTIPADSRVQAAARASRTVEAGPFTRAVGALATRVRRVLPHTPGVCAGGSRKEKR